MEILFYNVSNYIWWYESDDLELFYILQIYKNAVM